MPVVWLTQIMNAAPSRFRQVIIALVLTSAVSLSVASSAFAANNQGNGISGLVINQTGSYPAQSFYQAFCLAWHEQRNAGQFNVTLKETHSARFGRQVHILFDQQIAYVAGIPSNNPQWHQLAEQAAVQTMQQIQTLILQKTAYRDPDLAADEI